MMGRPKRGKCAIYFKLVLHTKLADVNICDQGIYYYEI